MPISLHVALAASVVIVGIDLPAVDNLVKELAVISKTDVQVLSVRDGDPDVLILDRERIAITILETQLFVSREYPSEEDLLPLANISTATLNFLNQPIEAIGYNVDLVFEQNSGRSAERYLGGRLFKHRELGGKEWPLWGGSGTMVFGNSQRRKSFNVAPRLEDNKTTRVLVEANYHVGDGIIPQETEIGESLATIWRDTIGIMELIDEEGNL